MNDMRYRIRVALLGASVLVALSSAAHAQQWPSKPIRWLVPVAAGGATDVVARLLQEPVGKLLGGTIVVENRPGGAGVIATQATVTSPPDGYTMALIYTSHPANAVMQPKLPYDSFKDITPVAFFWRAQLAFSVRTDSPLKSLQDLWRPPAAIPAASPTAPAASAPALILPARCLPRPRRSSSPMRLIAGLPRH